MVWKIPAKFSWPENLPHPQRRPHSSEAVVLRVIHAKSQAVNGIPEQAKIEGGYYPRLLDSVLSQPRLHTRYLKSESLLVFAFILTKDPSFLLKQNRLFSIWQRKQAEIEFYWSVYDERFRVVDPVRRGRSRWPLFPYYINGKFSSHLLQRLSTHSLLPGWTSLRFLPALEYICIHCIHTFITPMDSHCCWSIPWSFADDDPRWTHSVFVLQQRSRIYCLVTNWGESINEEKCFQLSQRDLRSSISQPLYRKEKQLPRDKWLGVVVCSVVASIAHAQPQ